MISNLHVVNYVNFCGLKSTLLFTLPFIYRTWPVFSLLYIVMAYGITGLRVVAVTLVLLVINLIINRRHQ